MRQSKRVLRNPEVKHGMLLPNSSRLDENKVRTHDGILWSKEIFTYNEFLFRKTSSVNNAYKNSKAHKSSYVKL